MLVAALFTLLVVFVNSASTHLDRNSYILRICDGPSCGPRGSFEVRESLKAELGESYIQLEFSNCFNACKRSCNIALVNKENNLACIIPGMSAAEKSKQCFSYVNTDRENKEIFRVSNLLRKYFDLSEE